MKEIYNLSVANILNTGSNLNFYLNSPNKRGWGVIYIRLRVGKRLIRVSTSVRVHKDFWSVKEGRIIFPRLCSVLDTGLHKIAENNLEMVRDSVQTKFYDYLCKADSLINERYMAEDIKSNLNKIIVTHIKPKKTTKSLITSLREIVGEMPNIKSQNTTLSIVRVFQDYLKDREIPDILESVDMETMRGFREWLVNERRVGVTRGKHCLSYIFSLCGKLERREGLNFGLDKNKIEPIRESRSMEERRQNSVALTEEELRKIEELEVKGDLQTAKDMFLFQCYCGFRFEDMRLILERKNLKEVDGIIFSVFETQKKGIISHTPLNNPNLYPQAMEIFERYADNCPYKESEGQIYNLRIKKIAKLAGLDREITQTSTQGEKKSKKIVKLWEKISSHSGRHTFITNAIRYKGLSPNVLIHITGHSDTSMIEKVYSNLRGEDKMNALNNALCKEEKEIKKSENKSPVEFAKWILRELGYEEVNKISLPELVNKISLRKEEIIKKYGRERYEKIKKFLGIGLGKIDKERLELLFCKAMGRNVRIIGRI